MTSVIKGSSTELQGFLKVLNLGDTPCLTNITIDIPAASLATVTITKLLTQDELDAITEWYVTENLNLIPE